MRRKVSYPKFYLQYFTILSLVIFQSKEIKECKSVQLVARQESQMHGFGFDLQRISFYFAISGLGFSYKEKENHKKISKQNNTKMF